MFGFFAKRRRKKIREGDFPGAWAEILETNFPIHRQLSAADQRELRGHILVFLDEKMFEGWDIVKKDIYVPERFIDQLGMKPELGIMSVRVGSITTALTKVELDNLAKKVGLQIWADASRWSVFPSGTPVTINSAGALCVHVSDL